MRKSVRRSEKGFTLIELGIVVAVIAILATVVLFGRGFLDSARSSKAMEAVNNLRKGGATYVGVKGGSWGTASGTNELADLAARNLVPPLTGTPAVWVIGDYSVTDATFQARAAASGGQCMGIKITAPSNAAAVDLYDALKGDADVTVACDGVNGTAAPTGVTLSLVFKI